MTRLLDANLLTALFDADHVHHRLAREWLIALDGAFSTCPIVEGALTRWIVRIEGRHGHLRQCASCAPWVPTHVIYSGRTTCRAWTWTGLACWVAAKSQMHTSPHSLASTPVNWRRSTVDRLRCTPTSPN